MRFRSSSTILMDDELQKVEIHLRKGILKLIGKAVGNMELPELRALLIQCMEAAQKPKKQELAQADYYSSTTKAVQTKRLTNGRSKLLHESAFFNG